MECILQKINSCSNNPDKAYTEKKAMHKPSGYSIVTCCSFDKASNEQKYYRGKDCIKKYCKDLKEQAMKIMNYEMKEMIPLTWEEEESYKNQKDCHICKKEFCIENRKSGISVIRQENIEELLIVFEIYATKYQKRFLLYFMIDLHMTIIS